MKKAILVLSVFISQLAFAYISDYEIVMQTNQFMNSNCSDFNTSNAMNKDLTEDNYLVVYPKGWAKVGINHRPPHDDSGKTTGEADVVVINYSCR
jgi:hypothetical protein